MCFKRIKGSYRICPWDMKNRYRMQIEVAEIRVGRFSFISENDIRQ